MRLRLIRAAVSTVLLVLLPWPAAGESIFDGTGFVTLKLEARFQELFDRAADDENATVPVVVTIGSETLGPATLGVRGNTSRQECAFPKLKLKFAGARDGAFADLDNVKINTHCGEAGDEELTRKYGRLANEHSPWREGLAYEMLRAIAVRTPRSRPARITYVDTSAHGTIVPSPVTRNALLLEDDDDIGERLEAEEEIKPDAFSSARELLTPTDAARLAFGEALVGNFDWCLLFTPGDRYRCDQDKKLWNLLVFRTGAGAVPVAYDLDLAGTVTGRHVWFDHVFATTLAPTPIATEVLAQVQRTRTLFSRTLLDTMRRELLARREAVARAIDAAPADSDGKSIARAYASAFFAAIATDDAFYLPVVVRPGEHIFTSAEGTEEACGRGDTVPIGTPVRELRRERGRAEVQILDALWAWAPPMECVPVHRGPVWIDAAAIGRDFPPADRR